MMRDDKLINLFEFYTGAFANEGHSPQRLSSEKYSTIDGCTNGEAQKHAAWMATQAIGFIKEAQAADASIARLRPTGMPQARVSKREKAHRWLGFIQSTLWLCGVFTLDELKEHSHKCSDDYEEKMADESKVTR